MHAHAAAHHMHLKVVAFDVEHSLEPQYVARRVGKAGDTSRSDGRARPRPARVSRLPVLWRCVCRCRPSARPQPQPEHQIDRGETIDDGDARSVFAEHVERPLQPLRCAEVELGRNDEIGAGELAAYLCADVAVVDLPPDRVGRSEHDNSPWRKPHRSSPRCSGRRISDATGLDHNLVRRELNVAKRTE